jgi:glycosyltransferase involved in cell wall biosynthesis
MRRRQHLEVAVLLATYNGARYVEQQLRSLKHNDTEFTLHWLDDHSTDNTRDIVRSVAQDVRIDLREWHQPQHLGVPGSFFQILDCVEADIYLFCDQDDIWQKGKITATVENLLPDLASPTMCFTDPLLFKEDAPDRHYRVLDALGVSVQVAMQESRIFMPIVGYGHTEGFTRQLREVYIKHKEIAREHAFMHDVWMYELAVASGTARLLTDAPTTLFRWHGNNSSGGFGNWGSGDVPRPTTTWREHQQLRRAVSQNAAGFILASTTLPQSSKLTRLLAIARLVAVIHKRQSPAALTRLIRQGAMWANRRLALETALVCLCSNATP